MRSALNLRLFRPPFCMRLRRNAAARRDSRIWTMFMNADFAIYCKRYDKVGEVDRERRKHSDTDMQRHRDSRLKKTTFTCDEALVNSAFLQGRYITARVGLLDSQPVASRIVDRLIYRSGTGAMFCRRCGRLADRSADKRRWI
jgi:hypothetical protein